MTTLENARAADAADPLRAFRDRFHLPPGVIYLDGNSLGPLPRAAADRLRATVWREWGEGLIRSWNDAGWAEAPRRVGAKIARLIGAGEDEVVVADSTSVNLFKLVMAAAGMRDGAIVAERDSFPTDAHIAERAAVLLGREYRAVDGAGLAEALTPDVAVAVITHVDYRTAAMHDMAGLTARAQTYGIRVVWDLSHSVGAVPLDLTRAGVELAVGCGYKYLNGGPGAPAFLQVARHLHGRIASPIAGWWSHAAPFAFGAEYQPAADITRFLAGTPPILGLAALETGIDLLLEIEPALLWEKARQLQRLFVERIAVRCPALTVVGPADPARRGSHVGLRHPAALAIVRALIARGVIGDFRTPDIARFGFTPLYIGHADVWNAVEALAGVMEGEEWRDPRFASGGLVT